MDPRFDEQPGLADHEPGPSGACYSAIVIGLAMVGVAFWAYFDGSHLVKAALVPVLFGGFLAGAGYVGLAVHHRKNMLHLMTAGTVATFASCAYTGSIHLFELFDDDVEFKRLIYEQLIVGGLAFLLLVILVKALIWARKHREGKNPLWFAD